MSISHSSSNSEQDTLPPRLPPRTRLTSSSSETPVDQLSLNGGAKALTKGPALKNKRSSSIEEHYVHLDKHVKEVRRRKAKNDLVAPKLSDYQKKQEDDSILSTHWIDYIEAWIKYIVSSAAYDEIDRPLEPFSLGTVKHDLDRLYPMVAPFIGFAKDIRHIYRWENTALTGMIATLYLILWYYDLILAFITIWITTTVCWVRMDTFAQYGVDVMEEQPQVPSWNQSFWIKMRTRMGTRSPYAFNLFDDISVPELAEWRNDVYKKYGPTFQLMLSDTVDYLERIKNLITWKRPEKTRFLLLLLVSTIVFLTLLPLKFTVKMFFLYIGFEFFVLQALRSYYPRHRRLFNVLNLLLWGVPNDAEYAIEVVRLSHGNSLTRKPKEMNDSLPPPKLPAPLSDISDNLTRIAVNAQTTSKSGFQEQAASTATTLATLAAAAAVNKVKKTVDNHKNKIKKEVGLSATDSDPEAFGCLYKGTIPGRISLRGNGFIFQTSRMTASKVLVECAFTDIIGVKKTRQFDMLVWHSSGIDISMVDGTVLRFEHVLRRDECFNRLVSASGGEWKKMS